MKYCLQCEKSFASAEWICPVCHYEPEFIDGFEAHAPELAYEGGGFKCEYFEKLVAVEEKSFWFGARNRLICWALKKYAPKCSNFLEIGCGTGFVISGIAGEFPTIKLFGSEIFVAGFSYAAKRVPLAKFMQMDARKIPFNEEFDALGAFDVLEHIKEDETVLIQLNRALRKGGLLMLTVPQHRWLWSAADDHACHVRRYEKKELHAKLEDAGFLIQRSTSFVGLLLPAMMVSRLVQKKGSYDPSDELRVPFVLNFIFKAIMYLEIAIIRTGINLPLGGSRLVIAKKHDKYTL